MGDKIENLEEKSNWGGARPNSGRPLGSMNKATREQKEAEEYFKKRVLNSIEELVNSQMNLAKGTQMLFRIDTDTDEKGRQTKSKPILVTSQTEIEEYLSGDYEEKDSYYFITTERPDNKAIDSLVDRVFGKAIQSVKHSGEINTTGLTEEQKEKLRVLLGYDKPSSTGQSDNRNTTGENVSL